MSGRCRGCTISVVLLSVVYSAHSFAGPYEDGDSAFRRKDYTAAMKHWRPLAEGENARAQARIAAMYLGGLGVARDYPNALAWCRKAADQGEPTAQYLLGSMYRDGQGVAKDLLRAVDLFRKAADQDLQGAQYNLGLMYFLGEGVPSNHLEAYHWFALAAVPRDQHDAQVHTTASYMLEKVSAKLTTDQLNQATQRASAWKPVQSR